MENNRREETWEVNDFFQEELSNWAFVREQYEKLTGVQTKALSAPTYSLAAQWNPARIVSTGAKIDKKTIQERPCFLCKENRPAAQRAVSVEGGFQWLINPYPILPQHFTLAHSTHTPQSIKDTYTHLVTLSNRFSDWVFFYNGPLCGASCPDHLHFQAGSKGVIPIQRDWETYQTQREEIRTDTSSNATLYVLKSFVYPLFVIEHPTGRDASHLFHTLFKALPMHPNEYEPRMNLISWTQIKPPGERSLVTLVIPRAKHRPDCYSRQGSEQILISPGAVDMGGLLITPREEDFLKITTERATHILQEVTLSDAEVDEVVRRMKS